MLVKFKQLLIENEGYKRSFRLSEIFINPSAIVSVVDYESLGDFLTSEDSDYAKDKFSRVKVMYGPLLEEFIVVGTATAISNQLTSGHQRKEILNG